MVRKFKYRSVSIFKMFNVHKNSSPSSFFIITIEKCIMYRLFIFKQYYAKIFVLLFDPTPLFDAPIRLYLLGMKYWEYFI
jgi:hypothetical protein